MTSLSYGLNHVRKIRQSKCRPRVALAIEAGLPLIDLNEAKNLQVLVDREKGQYLGHPTTLLLEDGSVLGPCWV